MPEDDDMTRHDAMRIRQYCGVEVKKYILILKHDIIYKYETNELAGTND
jgi:hypothetical protein